MSRQITPLPRRPRRGRGGDRPHTAPFLRRHPTAVKMQSVHDINSTPRDGLEEEMDITGGAAAGGECGKIVAFSGEQMMLALSGMLQQAQAQQSNVGALMTTIGGLAEVTKDLKMTQHKIIERQKEMVLNQVEIAENLKKSKAEIQASLDELQRNQEAAEALTKKKEDPFYQCARTPDAAFFLLMHACLVDTET